ncbi:MAG: phosphoribosyltransferase family protein [archaeon]
MCGIVGVISREDRDDIGALVAHGLYQIQNRGDHSAGIAAIRRLDFSRQEYRHLRKIALDTIYHDFNPLCIVKERGKVSEVFDEEKLRSLGGFMAGGQVRYPTAGYTIPDDQAGLSASEQATFERNSIQPLSTGQHSRIVMMHNGDVHNFREVTDHFKSIGLKQATNNDLEAILKVFAEEFFKFSAEDISNIDRLSASTRGVFERVKGTYSVISLVNNVGLVAFRDPNGRRPLFFGVNRTGGEISDYAFASETVALEKMLFKGTLDKKYSTGEHAYDEVKPGELVFISKDFELFRRQIAEPDLRMCPFEGPYFMRASSFLNDKRVKQIRKEIILYMWDRFAKESPVTYDYLCEDKENTIICPVPRTANSASVQLSNYLRNLGFEFSDAIEKHPNAPRIFMQPTQAHRDKQTIADHYIFQEDVKGKNIILIDDSIVRGTTLKQDINYLRAVGVKSIHVFITFPAIKNPCMHAVDFHRPDEIFAHNKSPYQMKRDLGLHDDETLFYMNPTELSKAIEMPQNHLCNECYR